MNKNTKLILIGLVLLVIVVALFMQNNKETIQEPQIVDEINEDEEVDTVEQPPIVDDLDLTFDLEEEIIIKDIKVDEGEVLISLPIETQGVYNQAALDRLMLEDSKIIDATLNEDRSITVKMTTEDQKELAESLLGGFKSIIDGLNENPEDFPYVKKIEVDDNVNSIKIYLNNTEYTLEDVDRLVKEIGIPAVSYKTYTDEEINVDITVVDESEVIKEYKYPYDLPKPVLEPVFELPIDEEKIEILRENDRQREDRVIEDETEPIEGVGN